jgi:hypothetical protein
VELALVDLDGVIVAVNDSWRAFCVRNGGDIRRAGVGSSYLDVCDADGDAGSRAVAASIRSAVAGELPAPVTVTISCPAPDAARSYDVLVSSRLDDDGACVGATVTLSEVQDDAPTPAGRAPTPDRLGDARDDDDPRDVDRHLAVRMEERERIAALLNDDVITELFSIGIGLQGMLSGSLPPKESRRIEGYVEATDALIRLIRSTVFELTVPLVDGGGLKRRILEAVDDLCSPRSVATDVTFTGPLDTRLAEELADELLDVVRVTLSEVTLPTGVREVSVAVSLSPSVVSVDIAHQTAGPADAAWPGELARLRRAAERRGGELEVGTAPGGGSLLHWTARVRG